MLKMENKNLIMLGMILGISLFFFGLMVNKVFEPSSTNMLPYKISAFLKIIGIGFFTCSMVIGGVILTGFDKNLKTLLLIFGLIMLIIYAIGSPWLAWDVSFSSGMMSSSAEYEEEAYDDRPTALATPGFEIVVLIFAIMVSVGFYKFKKCR